MFRRLRLPVLCLLATAAAALSAPSAQAADVRDYSRYAFQQAAQTGQRVLVIVSSRWKPSREDLDPMIYDMASDFRYTDVLFMRVDFDRRKDALRDLRINQDGVVIAYKGGQERGRLNDTSDEAELRRLLDAAR